MSARLRKALSRYYEFDTVTAAALHGGLSREYLSRAINRSRHAAHIAHIRRRRLVMRERAAELARGFANGTLTVDDEGRVVSRTPRAVV
jgi:hypothetical protein